MAKLKNILSIQSSILILLVHGATAVTAKYDHFEKAV